MKTPSHLSFMKAAYAKEDFVLKIWNSLFYITYSAVLCACVFNTTGGIYP